jgi:hypothetical protein
MRESPARKTMRKTYPQLSPLKPAREQLTFVATLECG